MADRQEFEIQIYHHGVTFMAPMRGKARYLQEKAFLDELTGKRYAPRTLPRPIPDPKKDIYPLDDAQLDAYSAFRKRLDKKG
jgi:hypothetical protein